VRDIDLAIIGEPIGSGAKKMTFDICTWLNEPASWRRDKGSLTVVTDAKTDFWRGTYYGFMRDSGHFYGSPTDGDFTAQLRVQAKYRDLYDQAGLMVRVCQTDWIKAGIEWSDGAAKLSSVLTANHSDWATAPYHDNPEDFRLRVTLVAGVLRLQVSTDGKVWPLIRLCPFPKAENYLVGPMCCTPERAGLTVLFSEFQVGKPLGRDLHDLS
jgi:regulation of enolase protein 1 (concanavalin A-like superfamily)